MSIPTKPAAPETIEQTFTRWLSDNTTWIGVFENKDLGHIDVGRRIAVPYDISQFEAAQIGVARASDSAIIGLGWRYVLVAKSHSVEGAIAALRPFVEEGPPRG
jgi:hypothetical protein